MESRCSASNSSQSFRASPSSLSRFGSLNESLKMNRSRFTARRSRLIAPIASAFRPWSSARTASRSITLLSQRMRSSSGRSLHVFVQVSKFGQSPRRAATEIASKSVPSYLHRCRLPQGVRSRACGTARSRLQPRPSLPRSSSRNHGRSPERVGARPTCSGSAFALCRTSAREFAAGADVSTRDGPCFDRCGSHAS